MTRAFIRRADADTPHVRPQGEVRVTKGVSIPESPTYKAMKAFQEKKQLPDPFKGFYSLEPNKLGDLQILAPPINPDVLMRMPLENNILRQCIEAMATNIVGHGYRMAYNGPDGQEKSEAALKERRMLESFIDQANEEGSLLTAMERVKIDKESLGYGLYEVGRDGKKRVTTVAHAPAHTFRRTVRDKEPTSVKVLLPRGDEVVETIISRRFCRWVQVIGARRVYFKEFGDPRSIDPATGEVNAGLSLEDSATEILCDEIYTPGKAYGMPRWIGQLPSVQGGREAELTNLDFFRENATPAMALLVAGGLVPQAALDQIEQLFTGVRGRKSMNRWVVIEAEGDHRAANIEGVMPTPKMELKALNNDRQKDGLFKEYSEECRDNIRSSFRIAGLFTGHAKDYTFASAKSAFEIADSQVFGPERNKTDDMVNLQFLAGYLPKFWTFRLQPARITDPEEIIRALKYFDGIGAMTPNVAIEMVNEYFDTEVPQITEEWGSYPFELVKVLATQGRLKGVEDIAEKLPMPGAPGTGTGGTPGRPDDPGDTEQNSPGDDTASKKKSEAAWAAVEGLRAIHTILREAA